ncbi:YdcF family protein [Sphingomonas sp. LaA6.9]|uniref:YdcF family protein n=1 Tax=Sphingomonas sp. LaA6.9 TaxID=2919914 RepID=UPI001F4FB9D7|nr:YdcF family protein [Sphingomonas sp. LaA6.9]MCJ8159241.1 YdcF family protein [Sphingomonas sp. LaA6.9]
MIKRILSIVPLLWALGFAAFTIWLPRPVDGETTDAIVVLTGAPGRIERGLALLEDKRAKRMLVSGVYRDVKPHELALAQHAPMALFDCCIDLGREATDTRSNAQETADWIRKHDYRSVRLVTTDWHMWRARHELERALDGNVRIVGDAVRSDPGFAMLFKEYHKYLLSCLAGLVGL